MAKVLSTLVRTVKTIILPIIVYLAFAILSKGMFGQPSGMLTIARQSIMPIMVALAITCNMTIGMWDFSAGAVVYTAAIVGGNLALMTGTGIPGLIVILILIAVALNTITGLLYNLFKVPSIVLTIGLMMVYEMIPTLLFKGGVLISGKMTHLALPPYCFIVFAVMFIIFYIVFNYTPFGHNVRALGSNQNIAANVGLNPATIKLASFIFGGVFLGMAAVMDLSTKGMIRPPATMGSVSMIFDAMMGIFIAFFLQKYCNLAIGVVVGTFTMKMLNSGLVSMGLSTTVRDITTGLFLLILLCISANQGKFTEWRNNREKARLANEKYRQARA